MSEIEKYILAFDELNALVETSFREAENEDVDERVKKIASDVQSILINAYSAGVKAASEMTDWEMDVDIMLMLDAVYKVIAGKDWEDRLIDHIMEHDIQAAITLVHSEYHRIWNAGVTDGAAQFAKATKTEVGKKWNTMLDDRVRDTHWFLEGVTIPLSEEFHTPDGDHGKYPGDFELAENNVNCRCWLTLELKYVG